MTGIVDSLLPSMDSILGIRDSIGALIKPVYFVTRRWTGSEPGDGTPTDVEVQMLPTPQYKERNQDLKLREGGVLQAGDIVLSMVSKTYTEDQLACSTSSSNIESFYRVGDKIYQVVNVSESYVTWKVTLKELTNQARYI